MSEESSAKKTYGHTEGIIFISRRGTGYVSDVRFEKDIEIGNQSLGTALNGDKVSVEILGKRDDRVEGAVERVLERAKTHFVGILQKDEGGYYLRPDNERIHVDIMLPENEVKDIELGTKLYVAMNEWDNPRKNPSGTVAEVIGAKGEHEVEMHAIILERGFEVDFPSAVLEEAKEIERTKHITEADTSRRDMRAIPTFTIDPHDAKDFDDALSVAIRENGDIEVGVHIADVTHYIKPGTSLEKEARKRATSIYLVDRTIPMLPEVLSNDICSLTPGEDKRTFSAVFVLDKNADIKERWFGETITHSNKRFTYEEAQNVLDTGDGVFVRELQALHGLAQTLRGKRKKNGAVSFEQDEIAFELDAKGKPVRIFKKKRHDTNKFIEDFMLLANEEVATYMYTQTKKTAGRDTVFIYRVHDVPDPERIEELGIFIRAIGYDFETNNGSVSSRDINKLFQKIEGTPEESLIKTATIRSMAKAVYSTKNIGHFGLAFKYYTHFTSPIRRYPDMMVHRIMKNHLYKRPVSDDQIAEYQYLAVKSSEREVQAVGAERDSIKYKQVEYMQEHVGEEFDAVISGVTDFGIFVEEKETKAEGLVRISTIGNDYYIFDPSKFRIVGEKTKKSFALGDEVRVKLASADLESRTLTFGLA